jgi:hypothetical protein
MQCPSAARARYTPGAADCGDAAYATLSLAFRSRQGRRLSRRGLSRGDSVSRDSVSRDSVSRDSLSRDILSRDSLSRDSLSRSAAGIAAVFLGPRRPSLQTAAVSRDDDGLSSSVASFRMCAPTRLSRPAATPTQDDADRSLLIINECKKRKADSLACSPSFYISISISISPSPSLPLSLSLSIPSSLSLSPSLSAGASTSARSARSARTCPASGW